MEPQIIRCASCGALNRVPQEKLDAGFAPVCGKCRTRLAIGGVITVTDATFADQVEQSSVPVLVDMWAEWCGPCKMIAPIVDQIAQEMNGRLRVAKLNVDQNPLTASRFQIQSIPALLVMQDGREVDRIIGAQPKSAILKRLQPYVKSSMS